MKRERDARGRPCPVPFVERMKALRECASGDMVEVKANDRSFPIDVAAWCKKTGHLLVRMTAREHEHVALVKKP